MIITERAKTVQRTEQEIGCCIIFLKDKNLANPIEIKATQCLESHGELLRFWDL